VISAALSGLLVRLQMLIVLSLVAFALAHLARGDPAEIMLRVGGPEPSPAAVAALHRQLGLDRPLPEQYVTWVGRAVRLDLGQSLVSRRPVMEEFRARLGATLELAGAGFLLAALFGLGGGLLGAAFRGGWVDRATWLLALAGASVPAYWVGLLLAYLFGVVLGWLPVAGNESGRHLILPAVTLACTYVGLQVRLVRASLLTALAEPFVVVARAKGLSRRQELLGHALPRAAGPSIHALGVAAGQMLGGAMVVETIFAWPGVGRLAVQSVFSRDYPMIQAYVLFLGTIFLAVNFVADLAHAWLDPTVRHALAPAGAGGGDDHGHA
jgi:peptide/nickel transport system permease protein